MSGSKHFDRIAWTVTAVMLALTLLFMNGASLGIETVAHTMGYEDRLFDNTRVHTVDIVMDNWDDFIASATSEEYHTASVVIDGESYKNVGIRAKGNTSLSAVASLDSERYSFKIEFDHYDSTKSYHGLDKLSLNNLIQDSTMMKDYLTYTMMNAFGVHSSLCSYVYITVNGEEWGLYLAVEGVEESFLERNYGSDCGELYKPDSEGFGGGRGNGKGFDMGAFQFDAEKPPADSSRPEGAPSDSGGGFGMGSADVKLQYIDDDPDSYSNIWSNAKTDISEADQNRLIQSLKKLSSGEDMEAVVDVEQVLRYFVVHNYVCNGDSYTGSMIHNYYLYEKYGQLAMIPWDYNLAFGTFRGGSGQSAVNAPIDAPVSGGSGEDRPMWSWIVSDEACTELYHQYFAEFLAGVDIQGIINNAYHLIKSYVEKDPTAFYSCEEFELGVETLRQFCSLRSESISMQLENGETTQEMSYVDASSLTLSHMGSMNGGMGGLGGNQSGRPGSRDRTGKSRPDDFASAGMPEGFTPSEPPEGFPGQFSGPDGDSNSRPSGDSTRMPGEGLGSGPMGAEPSPDSLTGWIWTAVSVLILAAGLITAKLFRHS